MPPDSETHAGLWDKIGDLLERHSGRFILAGVALTLLLFVPLLALTPDEDASSDPAGDVFALRDELNDRFETVNIGLSGYGVDQIYLRYLRDGITIEHSIHVFAFVQADLDRMGRSHVVRYGKPVLKLDHGVLVAENVPVPRFRWWVSRVVERAEFRSIDFVRRVFARLFPRKAARANATESIGPVASKVFQTVQQLSAEKNIVSVFVYLPAEGDIGTDIAWRHWVVATMNTLALPFVDLTPALRSLPAPRVATFFIPKWMRAAGHYTEAGNEWVAEVLYNYLMEIPRIQTLLAATNAPQIESD